MKKLFVITILGSIALLLVANYRCPFLKQQGGPWSIGFGSSQEFPMEMDLQADHNTIYPLENLKKINDSTKFMADPFFVKKDSFYYIFFEHQKNKPHATIGVLTSKDGKNYSYGGNVLQQQFHLSYPQVFQYRNDFYMIPESKGANAVLLYKAYDFPYDWRIADTLLANVRLKDPTVFLSDTLNIMVASDDNLNMYMYQADSLFGKWKLHQKPKVLCGSEARAGGRIIANKNGLMLPVQNCSNGYGFGLSLYELHFKNGDYTIERSKPFFLKQQPKIEAFGAGMHQFDIQYIDGKYYYTFDGNSLSENKKWNLKGSLKMNYLDLKNWFRLQFN